jgi:hypothetical protein
VGMSGLIQKYLSAALRAMGDPGAPDWPRGPVRAYDSVTMAEFPREQGASRGTIELLAATRRDNFLMVGHPSLM